MAAGPIRVYADWSVFGGVFDEEFDEERAFFDDVRSGRFVVVISPVTLRELDRSPEHVQRVLADLPDECIERFAGGPDVLDLRDAYLRAGVVGGSARADAEHVAAATVANVDMIVSWNFKHIVHFEKIRGYNGVNLLHGYRPMSIFSPMEVVDL